MTNHTAQSKVEHLAEPVDGSGRNTKAVEFLTLAGFTLHGNDWIVPLAGELAIGPDEIRHWLSGEKPLTMEEGIWLQVFKALRNRSEKLIHLHDEIHSAFQAASKKAGSPTGDSKAGELPVKPLHILR